MKAPKGKARRRKAVMFLLLGFLFLFGKTVSVFGAGENPAQETDTKEELLEDTDLQEVQKLVDQMLEGNRFDLEETIRGFMTGEVPFTKEAAGQMLQQILFSKWDEEKGIFLHILLLVLAASLLGNLSRAFEGGQIGEIAFYILYLLLFVFLVESFSSLSLHLENRLLMIQTFMQALAPAYFIAVTAASGVSTAVVFYQMALFLIWLIQWALVNFLLPTANLYVLLKLVNYLSKEEMLSKLAELLKTFISWGIRTMLGIVIGMQVIQGMVTPIMDSLKRSALGKTAGAIPGVGNAINAVTEIVLTSAVLVRNCMGVTFLVVLILWGITPIIRYGITSLLYRLLAALVQPVSDSRIVGCLTTMGEGCSILLQILFTAQVMCMLTIAILTVSFGGGT